MPAQPADHHTPNPELGQLLIDFTARISHDWADTLDTRKHGDAFRGVGNLPSKNAFYHDLADVLNARYAAKYGRGAAYLKEIKHHTVRRIFEEGDRRNFDDRTRDMLAVYLGYANWAAYRMRTELIQAPTWEDTPPVPSKEGKSTFTLSAPKYGVIAVVVIMLLSIGAYYGYIHYRTLSIGKRLTIVSVSSPHAPAKITVQYDLRGLDYKQAYVSYGRERVVPQREQGVLTFDAYLPLVLAVKLFVDNNLLAEAPLVIGSEGWEGYLSLLVPLEKEAFYQKGLLHLSYTPNPRAEKEEFYPAFLNFRDYGVSADNMLFEARVLNNAAMGGQWAYDLSIDLVGNNHRAYFNVLSPDAVVYARAGVAEVELNGSKNHELKALGYAMNDWCVLAMRIEDQNAVILINGKPALTIPYREELGDLRGIQFYLKGSGAIDWVRVTDLEANKVAFFDDFLGETGTSKKTPEQVN